MSPRNVTKRCAWCNRDRPVYCKNLCRSCYNRLQLFGNPTPRYLLKPSFEQRFWAKVNKTSDKTGCWIWTGAKDQKGYGHVSHTKLTMYSKMAHRTSWILLKGEIPFNLQLDHLCLNKACVNPAHLEPVTNIVNMERAKAARTTCRRGHPYDEVNTFYRLKGDGSLGRGCRTCREAARQRFHQRNPNYYSAGMSVILEPARVGKRGINGAGR